MANGKIYAIGGYNGNYLNYVIEYDPVTNTWTGKAPMPTARSKFGITSANNKIYVIGGYNGTSYLNTVEEYDPVTNTWTTKNSMPIVSSGLGSGTANGKVYAIGGYNGTSYLTSVFEFDPVNNIWTSLNKESMSIARGNFGITSLNGKIYVSGGDTGIGSDQCYYFEEYSPVMNSWTIKTNMPTARSGLGAVAINEKIFAIGGIANSNYQNKVEVYSQVTNTWTTKADMTTARSGLGLAYLNGKIYAIGGYNGTYLNMVEIYNPLTNSWSPGVNMQTARTALGVVALDGKIYAIGGDNGSNYLDTVEVFDPTTNTWSYLPVLPTAKCGFGIANRNNKIYTMGGKNNDEDILYSVQTYDPITNTWTSYENELPTARSNCSAATMNNNIYVVGGYRNDNSISSKIEQYNGMLWETQADMPTARENLAVVEANGKLYAIGGNNNTTFYNAIEEYDPGALPWKTMANMPTARSYLGTAAVNGKIYAIGGSSNGVLSNGVEEYNPLTNTWSFKNDMSVARDRMGVVTLDSKIYVIGGFDGANFSSAVHMYDPENDIWISRASMTYPRGQLGVVVYNGKIYAIGGYNGSACSYVEVYDPSSNTWTTKASMPFAKFGLGAAVENNKIYVFGGRKNNGSVNYDAVVQVYNPETNTWSNTSVNLPGNRADFGIEEVNNKIYLLGGDNGGDRYRYQLPLYIDNNETYDPYTSSWTGNSKMPTSRAGLGVAEVNGKIYAIGGVRFGSNYSATALQTVEVYDPAMDSYTFELNKPIIRNGLGVTSTNGKIYAVGGVNQDGYLDNLQSYDGNVWSNLSDMPTARKDLGVAAVNTKIFAVGGYNGNYLQELEEFDSVSNTWTTNLSNMPTARSRLSLVESNGRIYAIGGYNGNYLNTVEEYDPYTGTWTTKANMPTARADFSAVNLNGIIYVLGGKNSTGLVNSVEIFDPVRNSWDTGANILTSRFSLGAAALNGMIYTFGGHDGNDYLSSVEEYNPAKNSWTAKPNMLNPRAYLGAVSLGANIYLIGGSNTSGYLDSVEKFNPGTITWAPKADMPTSRRSLGADAVNGIIYAIGGVDDSGNDLNTVEAYNQTENAWSSKTGMQNLRHGLGVVAVNGKVYAIGGINSFGLQSSVEEYDPVANTWVNKTSMSTARYGLGAAAVDGKVYVVGGYNNTDYLDTLEVYDPVNDSWDNAAAMPTDRAYFGVCAVNGKIYAIGGLRINNEVLNNVEEYDPVTNTWVTKASMPTARYGLSTAVINGKIYAIGGTSNNTVEVYDPSTDSWDTEAKLLTNRDNFGIATVNGKIYVIGGGPTVTNGVDEGSFGENSAYNSIAEFVHLGEENVNLSGNFARTYTDIDFNTSGFSLELTRTYNSRDDREDSFLSKGWSFGFQGSLKDYYINQVMVRLPNGSAMTFTKNPDNSFTANDSRATLVKQPDNTHILTTKDQYTYGFNTNGWLTWMKDRNGNTISLTVNAADGKVTAITDQIGRQISISYNLDNYIETITDQANRTIEYEYEDSHLVRAIDPMGKITRYTYNAQGYLSEIRDHDNNLIESVVYDDSAGENNIRIARLTDAYGNISNYMYDAEYRKLTVTDTNGREKITWFDGSLYPIQTQDPDGRRSTVIYTLDENGSNKYGEAESITDRNGNRTVYERDSRGNITRIYNPDSSFQEFGYDSKNNKIWEKDEDGKYTFYIYDTNKINLLKKAQPLNGTDQYTQGCNETLFAITTYTYYTYLEAQAMGCNIYGLLKSETDPDGHVTTYTYDTYGNIHTVTNPENKTVIYTYNNLGWKTSMTSPKGYITSYVYDQNGNLEKETLQGEDTSVTRTTYDNMGHTTKVVTPNLYDFALDNLANHTYSGDHGYRYTYYPSGKIQTQTDPEGNTTTYTYDVYGNIQTETKPNGSVIEYFYDNLNRLSAVKFKDTAVATPLILNSYSHQILVNGNTKKTETKYLNDTETAVTQYTYDYKDRLIRQDNPDGTYTLTSYNANGTVDHITDARGYSTYLRYNGLNRNTETWIPSATNSGNTLYTYKAKIYDKAGNILTEKTSKLAVELYQVPADANCITVTREYYLDNRLKSEVNSASQKNEYYYDNDGNLNKKDLYTTSTTKISTEYVNNYLNKPVQEKLHVRAGDLYCNSFTSDTDTVLTTQNTYDKNGNFLTTTRPDNVVITYTYDNLNRLLSSSMPGLDENNNAVTIVTSQTYDWTGKILTQTDANAHIVTNEYNAREQLIKVTDAKGYTTAFYYDRSGRLIAEVAPNNFDPQKTLNQMSRTEYTYDLMDRLKTKSYTYLDPNTSQWLTLVAKAYQYDANGNVVKELDALGYENGTGTTADEKINTGYSTCYTYDPANRLLTILDPVSQQRSLAFTTKFTYDGAGRKTSETNAKGVVTSYTYNDAGNLITTQVSNQTTQTNTYDLANNLLTQTDGNGNTVTYSYNAFGKLKQAIYPGDSTIPALTFSFQYYMNGNLNKKENTAGAVDLYTYNNQGQELSHTQQKTDLSQSIITSDRYDKAGNLRYSVDGRTITTEYVYDENNRKIQNKITVTDSNDVSRLQTTVYDYDKVGNLITQTDWLGNAYTNTYDLLGRLIEKKDPLNKTIEKLEYNHNSSQIKSYDALNNMTEFTYDRNNRKLSTIDPLTHTISQTYDDVGNIKSKTDGEGNTTTYNYNDFNCLTSVVNAKNETTSYTYDLNGNKLTQTDGENRTITFEYNVANKVSKKIDHGGRTGTPGNYTYDSTKVESYTYNTNGNLLTKLDRKGNTTTYTYDVHNRMLSQVSGSLSISYTYDGTGNQLTMTDGTGTTTRTYDQRNRTKTKTVPGGVGTFTFLYDQTSGLPTGQVSETETDPKGNVTTKVYDQVGRMISVSTGVQTTSYTYYDNGSKHTVLYPDGSNEAYTYYDDGLLHSLLNVKADLTVIDAYSYTYDAAHNMTSKVDSRGTTTYTYDELNRLLTVSEPSGKITEYTFDHAGNRLSQTETIGTTNVVTTYIYNNQNRLTNTLTLQNGTTTQTVTYTYDNNGNEITITKVPYVNGIPQTAQINQCTYDNLNQMITTALPEGTNIDYTYNGEGLRVTKQVNGQITKYVYVGDKVVLELDGSNNQIARNIQGTNLIARNVGGLTLYYMYNGHADVTTLLDGSGNIQATYYYDAFGNILEQTGTADNPYTYAGYQYDDESGLYYLNSRYYNPITARFLSEDTYYGDPNDPLSLNLYTYCANSPITYTDPTGHVYVYGNSTDIANAMKYLSGSDYTFVNTSTTYVDPSKISSDSIIVGGTGAAGGVASNPNGARRIAGEDRNATITAMQNYSPTNTFIYGNTKDTTNASTIINSSGYTYVDTSHLSQAEINASIRQGDIIVGGTGAKGGVATDAYGALRIAGDNSTGTNIALGVYTKSTSDINNKVDSFLGQFSTFQLTNNGSNNSATLNQNLFGTANILSQVYYGSGTSNQVTVNTGITIDKNTPQDVWVKAVYEAAKLDEARTGVPAAITTAQAILESGYGKYVPTDMNTGKYSYNLFGIKGSGTEGSVQCKTREYDKNTNKYITITADFAAYSGFEDSIKGHSEFLMDNRRYASLFNSNDPVQWAYGLQKAGYATDPKYAQSLINVMDYWKLK